MGAWGITVADHRRDTPYLLSTHLPGVQRWVLVEAAPFAPLKLTGWLEFNSQGQRGV